MRETTFSSNAIVTMINWVSDSFLERFKKVGLSIAETAELITDNDPSLFFVNSTIAPLKDSLRSGNFPYPGIASVQTCFRSNNLASVFDPSADLSYHSYFWMLGALTKPGFEKTLYENFVEYLMATLDIEPNRLKVRSSHRLKEVNLVLNEAPLQISMDENGPPYYTWQYGMDGITGEGATLAMHVGDTYEDLGNLIRIVDARGICLGWELGFGVEVLLARKFCVNVFEALPFCLALPYQDSPTYRKFADCLISSVELLSAGLEPSHNRHGYVLKKFIKGLALASKLLGKTEKDVHEISLNYCAIRKHASSAADKLRMLLEKHIAQYKRNVAVFQGYVRTHPRKNKVELLNIALDTFSVLPSDANAILGD